jgi:hypothetical protein
MIEQRVDSLILDFTSLYAMEKMSKGILKEKEEPKDS